MLRELDSLARYADMLNIGIRFPPKILHLINRLKEQEPTQNEHKAPNGEARL